jgi:hypothetical protein
MRESTAILIIAPAAWADSVRTYAAKDANVKLRKSTRSKSNAFRFRIAFNGSTLREEQRGYDGDDADHTGDCQTIFDACCNYWSLATSQAHG